MSVSEVRVGPLWVHCNGDGLIAVRGRIEAGGLGYLDMGEIIPATIGQVNLKDQKVVHVLGLN